MDEGKAFLKVSKSKESIKCKFLTYCSWLFKLDPR